MIAILYGHQGAAIMAGSSCCKVATASGPARAVVCVHGREVHANMHERKSLRVQEHKAENPLCRARLCGCWGHNPAPAANAAYWQHVFVQGAGHGPGLNALKCIRLHWACTRRTSSGPGKWSPDVAPPGPACEGLSSICVRHTSQVRCAWCSTLGRGRSQP